MSLKSIALGSVAGIALASAAIAADVNSARQGEPFNAAAADTNAVTDSEKINMPGTEKPVTASELKTAIPLSKVKDPVNTLKGAEIQTMNGDSIGHVDAVTVTEKGKFEQVRVDIGGFLGIGAHTVALDPAKLKYVSDRNIVVTGMSKDELKALPEAG